MNQIRPALPSSPCQTHALPGEIVLWAARWYCRYPISYPDLEAMMTERGVAVDHSTIYRWVQRFAPEMEKRLRWQWRRPQSRSYRSLWSCLGRNVLPGATVSPHPHKQTFILGHLRPLGSACRHLSAPASPAPPTTRANSSLSTIGADFLGRLLESINLLSLALHRTGPLASLSSRDAPVVVQSPTLPDLCAATDRRI